MTDRIPNGYDVALSTFRTPDQRLAAEQKSEAFAKIEAEAADNTAQFRALAAQNATDLTDYEPPCGYCGPIDKMRSEGR